MPDLERFARRLVERLESRDPTGRYRPINVGELRNTIMPYRLNRSALALSSHEDYELLVLRLVAEEGGWVRTNPPASAEGCREELRSPNPDLDIVGDLNDTTIQFGATQLTALAVRQAALGAEPGRVAPGSEPLPPPAQDRAPIAAVSIEGPPAAIGAPPAIPLVVETQVVEAPIIETPIIVTPIIETPVADRPVPDPLITDRQVPAAERAASPECRACSRPLPVHRHVTFCPFCGSQVGLVRCGKCGDEIEPGWRHCVGCGTPAASG